MQQEVITFAVALVVLVLVVLALRYYAAKSRAKAPTSAIPSWRSSMGCMATR